jgi:hypothetical protein
MRGKSVVFASCTAALSALSIAGCGQGGGGGPTMPSGPDLFTLSATMVNPAGAPTILDAVILLDNFSVANSCRDLQPVYDSDGNIIDYVCDSPGAASARFSAAGNIGPGSHTLQFFLVSQTPVSPPISYTVMPFNLVIRSASGQPLKTVSLPGQTASLGDGASIFYNFSF